MTIKTRATLTAPGTMQRYCRAITNEDFNRAHMIAQGQLSSLRLHRRDTQDKREKKAITQAITVWNDLATHAANFYVLSLNLTEA